jgi:hypothetical protein
MPSRGAPFAWVLFGCHCSRRAPYQHDFGNETALTIEQGAPAQVKTRAPRPRWIPGFVLAGLCLPFAASSGATGDYRVSSPPGWR